MIHLLAMEENVLLAAYPNLQSTHPVSSFETVNTYIK